AAWLLVEARQSGKRLPETAEAGRAYLARWPAGRAADEVRFTTARALEGAGEHAAAVALLSEIWYRTPSSPRAKEAHASLGRIRERTGISPRALEPEERYDFVKALQKAGLHEDALEEVGRYLSGKTATRTD